MLEPLLLLEPLSPLSSLLLSDGATIAVYCGRSGAVRRGITVQVEAKGG